MNASEFIDKAKKIHGEKYDYSKVEYKNSKTKVCIICPEHGEFMQIPNSHLMGCGCPKCGKVKHIKNETLTTEDFIKRARAVHGDKYDYSKVEYKNANEKVCIICPKHGEFWQTPASHYNMKRNCPLCSHQSFPSTKEQFIEKARKVHGDKYDYSKVEYKNNKTKVCITCPKHGDFFVRPDNHIHGAGCKKCSVISTHILQTKGKDDFINEAKKVHGNRYDYSKVEYVNNNTKICIICPKHGEFWQSPFNHLSNHGCPVCNESKAEKRVSNLLTEYNIKFERWKTFKWLINKKNMFLDFYLPEHNIAIECQGIQHFFESKGFFNEDLKTLVGRDEKKKELCEEHGVTLLYYSILKEKTPDNVIKNDKILIEKIYENSSDR